VKQPSDGPELAHAGGADGASRSLTWGFVLVSGRTCALIWGRRVLVRGVFRRTVKTASGTTAVQIGYSSRRGSRQIEHLGSAHSEAEVEAFKASNAAASIRRAPSRTTSSINEPVDTSVAGACPT